MKKFFFWLLLSLFFLNASGRAFAVEAGPMDKVSQKLDELLKGQKQILQELAEIKQELYIVKIRASRR